MKEYAQELLSRINSLSEYSDQKEVKDIRERIMWLNIYDPDTKKINDAARLRNVIP